ncbi:MAG: peptide-methionine (S)-S-oxide reductase MsrA [Methylophilaceae bacterium]|nr:peptide-methionine (S)-S-oxide reductase MsrA [Methylophilaceae bacterium]
MAEIATLAGGCFWCLEAVYRQLRGVEKVVSGFTGGHVAHPTYAAVCSGDTGHAEAVQIGFDPEVITFRELLEVFFASHDPTTRNRQGHDVGTQYRSAIFYHTEAQRRMALETIAEIDRSGVWPRPVVTEVAPAGVFYPAEAEHQDYFARHPWQPYCVSVIAPKVGAVRQQFPHQIG